MKKITQKIPGYSAGCLLQQYVIFIVCTWCMKELLILHNTPGSKSKKKVPPQLPVPGQNGLENGKKLTAPTS
jgi:hypothetical protein